MTTPIEVIIHGNGAAICHPYKSGVAELFVDTPESFGKELVEFLFRADITPSSVILYVSEELLFFKSFELPLKTPNLKEAIEYQLGLIAPFSEDSYLYSYSTVRTKNDHKIKLFAVQHEHIDIYMKELIDAGYTLSGVYPESQRYVGKAAPKDKWALVMPGRFAKVYIFIGARLQDRLLCNTTPQYDDLLPLTETDRIYFTEQQEDGPFLDAGILLAGKPFLKDFNLLPSAYHRPDYFKAVVGVLLALNLLLLLGVAGLKVYRLNALDGRVSEEISKVMPTVKEVRKLQARERELNQAVEKFEKFGENPDLINFFKNLTSKLPLNSYLDQMQLDKRKGAIQIRGYTEDISELTSKLQGLGEIKLKSTSRRKNQTYFNVEINLR